MRDAVGIIVCVHKISIAIPQDMFRHPLAGESMPVVKWIIDYWEKSGLTGSVARIVCRVAIIDARCKTIRISCSMRMRIMLPCCFRVLKFPRELENVYFFIVFAICIGVPKPKGGEGSLVYRQFTSDFEIAISELSTVCPMLVEMINPSWKIM